MLHFFFSLFLCGAPAQAGIPAPFDASRQTWDLALIGARVEAMPEGEWFGGPDWSGQGVVFRASGDASSAECQVLLEEDFERNDLRFHFDRRGASVQIDYSSDIRWGPLQDVGGLACLVTNGVDTVLEYELYTVCGGYQVWPSLAGAVLLHGAGRDLALDLASRPVPGAKSPFARFVRISSLEDHSESHGYVDELGRKQGTWALRQTDGRRLEVSWRDGVPHGNVLAWDEQGRLWSLVPYRAGLQEGESMDWNEEGGLRSCESFVRGRSHGRRLVFFPSGAKELEMACIDGRQVGRIKKWSESGELISDEPNLEELLSNPEIAKVDRACFSRFDGLHTRPRF